MKTKGNPKWKKAVREDHRKFTMWDVVKDVPKEEVTEDATIFGST